LDQSDLPFVLGERPEYDEQILNKMHADFTKDMTPFARDQYKKDDISNYRSIILKRNMVPGKSQTHGQTFLEGPQNKNQASRNLIIQKEESLKTLELVKPRG
jgi:hypothetical protein